jgi:cytoskeletal protein RodZ
MRVTSVGEELRRARQAAGLTPEDIAQRTKIQLAKIEALEESAYERLPEGIYLDGIVRAYAHELRMDGDRLVVQLRAERAKPRDVAAGAASPEARTAAAPATTFGPPRPLASDTGRADITREVPPEPPGATLLLSPRPLRRNGRAIPLIALAIAFGVGVYLGGAFYPFDFGRDAREQDASARADQETADSRQRVDDAEATARDADATTARRPGDWSVAASREHAADAASAPLNDPRDRPERTTRTLPAPVEDPPAREEPRMHASASGLAGSSPPVAPSAREHPPAATGERPAPAPPPAGASGAPIDPAFAGEPAPPGISSRTSATDVSGAWILTTVLERTAYRDLAGLEYGYRLELRQDGNRVTGVGLKATENGREIADAAQAPVRVEGIIDGDRLELTLLEKGPQRVNRGRVMLYADGEGHLRGRFAISAPEGSGTAVAIRRETTARRVP